MESDEQEQQSESSELPGQDSDVSGVDEISGQGSEPGINKRPLSKTKKKEGGWLQSVLIAIALALGIRHFLVQAYKIPSGSMIPTLLIGDQLIADKFSFGIRLPFSDHHLVEFGAPGPGDVVVFRFPEDPTKDFIKRTIGTPGDRIRIENGVLIINDTPVPRTYIDEQLYRSHGHRQSVKRFHETLGRHTYTVQYSAAPSHLMWNMEEIQLNDHEIFVMGDNRDHSNDSRFWGTVDLDLLEADPLFIHFSWDSETNSIRWGRFGIGLN